jgi:hypothetical protein
MAASQEFDPFNKVSGELLISDLLNAFLVLANFIRGGLSINKRGGFSFNNSKTGANKQQRADLPPFRIDFLNTHDDDTADPGRKIKGRNRAVGSAYRRNKNSKKRQRSKRRNSNVISEVERERRLRQSKADKAKFALLQQQLLDEKKELMIREEGKKKEHAHWQRQRKKVPKKEKMKAEKVLRVDAPEFVVASQAAASSPPFEPPSSSASMGASPAATSTTSTPASSSASMGASPATIPSQQAAVADSLPPTYLQMALKARSLPLTIPPPVTPSFFGSRGVLIVRFLNVAFRPRPEYPGVKLPDFAPIHARIPYDLRAEFPFTLPDGRQHLIYFYRQRLDLPGPLDGVWVHDYNPEMPGTRSIHVVRESVEKR